MRFVVIISGRNLLSVSFMRTFIYLIIGLVTAVSSTKVQVLSIRQYISGTISSPETCFTSNLSVEVCSVQHDHSLRHVTHSEGLRSSALYYYLTFNMGLNFPI